MAEQITLPEGISAADLAEALALLQRGRRKIKPPVQDTGTIHIRGEGGAVFEMTPSKMTDDMRARLRAGRLRRVNPDGSPYNADVAASAAAEVQDTGPMERPAKSAPKTVWVEYAVRTLGLTAEEADRMTRQDLIELPPDYKDHDPLTSTGPEPDDDGDAVVGDAADGEPKNLPASAGKPSQSDPKSVWIDYVVRQGLMAREDAETYTKADLIDLAK